MALSVRKIAVITVGRSDFGILKPVLAAMSAQAELSPLLWVTGAHLSEQHGGTVREIEKDGIQIARRIPVHMPQQDAAVTAGAIDVAAAMSEIVAKFGLAYAAHQPDIVFALGDRYEMLAAVVASVPFNIPVAHLHGGEVSYGAIDEVFRHAITKMAHIHFAATPAYANRIIAMGEEPWRVHWTGAPALDSALTRPLPSRAELQQQFGFDLSTPPVLVTFHAETRDPGMASQHVEELLAALAALDKPIVFTAPNADPGGISIRAALTAFVADRDNAWLVESLGSEGYFAMLREAAVAVGNSSSGLIETACFELPTVNVGHRQDGRIAGRNVIHAPCERGAISGALARALDPDFRKGLHGMKNPYGRGGAATRIVDVLKSVDINPALLRKRFHDVAWAGAEKYVSGDPA